MNGYQQKLVLLKREIGMQKSHEEDIDIYLNLDGSNGLNHVLQQQEISEESQNYGVSNQSQILLSSQNPSRMKESTLDSQKMIFHKKKIAQKATSKYRERKKKYTQEIEENVKKLEQEIMETQQELANVKDSILEKLTNSAKMPQNSENAQIFNELEEKLNNEELADFDSINLLLDTLAYRIGPSGRQRQAKIDYNFKNIINTIFPALHRYLMTTASKGTDFFKSQGNQNIEWTKNLSKILQVDESQNQELKKLGGRIKKCHSKVLADISRLLRIKRNLKQQAVKFDKIENQFRECMNPIQCAQWTLSCERKKYHEDVFLRKANLHFYEDDRMEEHMNGRKLVHRSQ